MGRMCETLWRNKHLKHIEMDECEIGNQGGVAIGLALSRGSKLEYISVKKNEISDEGVTKIAASLDGSKCILRELYLNGNDINDAGGELLARSMINNNTLQKLDLSYNNLKNTTCCVFIDILKRNQFLLTLNLEGNIIASQFNQKIKELLLKNGTKDAKYVNK